MNSRLLSCLILLLAPAAANESQSTPPAAGTPASGQVRASLTWSPSHPRIEAAVGDKEVEGGFELKNMGDTPLLLTGVHASCGCAFVEIGTLPRSPQTLAPGETIKARVRIDLTHKYGPFAKSVYLTTDRGAFEIRVDVIQSGERKHAHDDIRMANMAAAKADRQAVFRADCARCHSPEPTLLDGQTLYLKTCAICHESPNRAEAVPALVLGQVPGRLENYWETWTREGRDGTMMPAFEKTKGGPLSEEQIAALLRFLKKGR
ncbi:MAG: DUF1573 domain-containing protein [Opitutaceae bacterium]|nr:DUF1573 domain-containing protein [Opitutaceae bacterium]